MSKNSKNRCSENAAGHDGCIHMDAHSSDLSHTTNFEKQIPQKNNASQMKTEVSVCFFFFFHTQKYCF